MSSLAPTKREHPTNSLPSRAGLLTWVMPYLTSTVGNKILVACTGLLLTGFVITHMVGNLQIFAGRDKINDYALFLKNMGPLLWVARIGLLLLLITHVALALTLKKRSLAARPIAYVHQDTIQATFASRTMVLTGLLVLAFIAYHLAHFTMGWTHSANGENYLSLHDSKGRHDVYAMMIAGFRSPFISILYLIAQAVLFVHLSHGVASVFQTLGLNTPRTQGFVRCLGYSVASLVLIGNCAIVVAVWFGFVK